MEHPFYPLEYYISQYTRSNRDWIKKESLENINKWLVYYTKVLECYKAIDTSDMSSVNLMKVTKRISLMERNIQQIESLTVK